MNNVFDQFDLMNGNPSHNDSVDTSQGNPFDQFDNQWGPTPAAIDKSVAPPQPQSPFWDGIDVMNRNFAKVANGTLQASAQALKYIGLDTTNFLNNIAQRQAMHERDYNAAYKNSPITSAIVDPISQVAATIATPGTQGLWGAGANVIKKVGASILGSTIAGASEYVPDGSSQTRAENALMSGAIGAVGQGTVSGLGAALNAGKKIGANTAFESIYGMSPSAAKEVMKSGVTLSPETGNIGSALGVLGGSSLGGMDAGILGGLIGKASEKQINKAFSNPSVINKLIDASEGKISENSLMKDLTKSIGRGVLSTVGKQISNEDK